MQVGSMRRWWLLVLAFAVVLALVPVATAQASPPVKVEGASTLDSTHVKISFNQVVPTAASPTKYSVSPSLAVTAATLADGGNAVVLTTATQTNARSYTVTVSGIGSMTPTTQTATFIGTLLGPASTASFQDDFNRPSGWLATDTPVSGMWTVAIIDDGNQMGIVSTPTFAGSGALWSHVASLGAETDNASLQRAISANDFYLSAYVYIPSGQGWGADQQVGVLRLNEYEKTAHARVTAYPESGSAYTLKVNWKESATVGYHGDTVVATGVTFDAWHWLQLHVKNGAAGTGEVQVYVDGSGAYSQNSIEVRSIKMTRAEVGIMHMATSGPSATVYTDEVRMGTNYQLPSRIFDTTAPTGVIVTFPSAGQVISTGVVSVAAVANDNVGVQRVDFVVDGTVAVQDDIAPYSAAVNTLGLNEGPHTLVVRAYDTSGLSTASAPVSFTVRNPGPEVLSPSVAPNPFSPNGDGYQDKATVTFTTTDTTTQRVRILDSSLATVKTLRSWATLAAGSQSLSWNGTYYDKTSDKNLPAANGAYTVRIEAKDSLGRVTTVDLPLVLNRVLASAGRSPSIFSPNGDGRYDTVSISYTLKSAASAGVAIETAAGDAVRVVQAATAQAAGAYKGVVWDGKDSDGAVVPDGVYTIRVWAVNSVGRYDYVRTVRVDDTAPTLTIDSVTPDPWNANAGPLSVTFSASEAGTASVKFYRGTSSTSTATFSVSLTAAGSTTIKWNGVDKNGANAAAGTYRVKIYFADKAGNHTAPYPV